MYGTAAGLRTDAAAGLADLERRRPEWSAWLRLLGETLRALDDPAWGAPLREPAPADGPRTPEAPLLHGRVLTVAAPRLDRLVRDLIAAATAATPADRNALAAYRAAPDAAVELLAAVIGPHQADLPPDALATVARLAAVPLLHACGRMLQDQVPPTWSHGYCPICGSWPLLAELRSLERTRQLRCGRCGADWRVTWLRCTYCGERDHDRLGTLVLENEPETWTVETCSRCAGYLKAVTTLRAIPPFHLLLRDVETVELDVAALERGFSRPSGAGFPIDLRLTAEP